MNDLIYQDTTGHGFLKYTNPHIHCGTAILVVIRQHDHMEGDFCELIEFSGVFKLINITLLDINFISHNGRVKS